MIETGSEYQLLQHFEAIPVIVESNEQNVPKNLDTTVNIETTETNKLNTPVDGSKFEAFVESIINLIIVIPVK